MSGIGLGLGLREQKIGGPPPLPSTYHLNFTGSGLTGGNIRIPRNTLLDNIITEAFTIEFSGKIEDNQEVFGKYALVGENNSGFYLDTYYGVTFDCSLSTADGHSFGVYTDSMSGIYSGGLAHHYMICIDPVAGIGHIFIDGVEPDDVGTYGAGYAFTDVSNSDFYVIHPYDGYSSHAQINYFLVYKGMKHTSNFTPPSLTICPPADANTVLRLALDEGSDTFAGDTSGHGNDGTISGATWDSGALLFDGVDDELVFGNPHSIDNLLSTDFTIEVVMSPNATGAGSGSWGDYIFTKEDLSSSYAGLFVYVENSIANGQYYSFAIEDESANMIGVDTDYEGVFDGLTHHIEFVFVRSTQTFKIFIDGIDSSANPYADHPGFVYPDISAYDLLVFKGGLFDIWYKGGLNWMRVSNVARHTANFTPPSLTDCPAADVNTVFRLALDEGSGTVVKDSSGNNGTISGATWEAD